MRRTVLHRLWKIRWEPRLAAVIITGIFRWSLVLEVFFMVAIIVILTPDRRFYLGVEFFADISRIDYWLTWSFVHSYLNDFVYDFVDFVFCQCSFWVQPSHCSFDVDHKCRIILLCSFLHPIKVLFTDGPRELQGCLVELGLLVFFRHEDYGSLFHFLEVSWVHTTDW